MEMQLPTDAYGYPRTSHNMLGSPMAFVDPSLYNETNYMFNSKPSSGLLREEHDPRGSSSNLSIASLQSSAPSTVSSPQSNPSHTTTVPDWSAHGLAIGPGIVGHPDYIHPADYPYGGAHLEDLQRFAKAAPGYVGKCAECAQPYGACCLLLGLTADLCRPYHDTCGRDRPGHDAL